VRTSLSTLILVSTLGGFVTPAVAQDKVPPIAPLKVDIVVSRYQGDKKVSNLPYTLAVNANDGTLDPLGNYQPGNPAQLRTGASVPVPSLAAPKESPIQGPMGPVIYKQIGINIDCWAQSIDGGRFKVDIRIDDTSVYAEGQTAPGIPKIAEIPSFRTFQSHNAVMLKDGQSSQFTAAADRITGEVTKVDVTISVVK
jgi:hypothetical protein